MPCLCLCRHTPLLWWNLCYVLFLFSFSFFLYFLDVYPKPFCWVFVPAVVYLISKSSFLCSECLCFMASSSCFVNTLLLFWGYWLQFSWELSLTSALSVSSDFLCSLSWSFTFMLAVVHLSETLKACWKQVCGRVCPVAGFLRWWMLSLLSHCQSQ